MATNLTFWQWLTGVNGVGASIIQGDPNYYSSGQASAEEYAHAIRVAIDAAVNNPNEAIRYQFWKMLVDMGLIQGDHNYYADGRASQAEIDHAIAVASRGFASNPSVGTKVFTFGPTTVDPADGQSLSPGQPVDAGDTSPGGVQGATGSGDSRTAGVMSGGKLVRVTRPNAPDAYVMVYDWNGTKVYWTFESMEQLAGAMGTGWQQQVSGTVTDSALNNWIGAGGAEEIIGNTTHFNTFIQEAQNDAIAASGIRDPGLAGRLAADPEYQRLLTRIAIDDNPWSQERIMGEVRRLAVYKDVIFPGIEQFYGYDDPEQAWYQYMSNVESSLEALGVQRDPDGSYRSRIGTMLRSGVSDDLFIQMTPTFIKAQNNQQYAEQLDRWFRRELGRGLDFDTWFDVLSGVAQGEVTDVVNKAVLAYTSQQQLGQAVSDADIERIAGQKTFTEETATQAFNDFATYMRAMDGVIGKYGVTRDELLSLATGISTQSGRSLEETQALAQQAAREAGVADDEKLKFYLGFSPLGNPERPGMKPLAPEGA